MMSGIQRFVDDDRGYLDWLAQHPDSFVRILLQGVPTHARSAVLRGGGRCEPWARSTPGTGRSGYPHLLHQGACVAGPVAPVLPGADWVGGNV